MRHIVVVDELGIIDSANEWPNPGAFTELLQPISPMPHIKEPSSVLIAPFWLVL
jgi:hypothetical protein